MCFDGAAGCNDRNPLAWMNTELRRKLRRDLTKQLGLKFGQMGKGATHSTCGVMFRQAISREHVRELLVWRGGVRVAGSLLGFRDGIGLLTWMDRIANRRFQWLVMSGQRTIVQTNGNPDPAKAIRVEDERPIAW